MTNQEQIILKKDGVPFVDMLVPLPPDQPTLFVVLHGLVALVEGDGEFRAYALSAGQEHEYLLGDWLSEMPMNAGLRASLELGPAILPANKDAGNSLDPSLTPVTKVAAFPDDKSLGKDVLARIILPRPAKLHHLNRGRITLSGTEKLLQFTDSICGAVVFEYHFQGAIRADLVNQATGGVLWRSENKSGAKGQEFTSLHMISQPPRGAVMPAGHPVAEFHSSAAFLGAAGVGIAATAQDLITQPEPPRGLSWLELEPFVMRALLPEKMRDFLRTGQWTSSRSLFGDCRSCCASLRAVVG